MDWKNILKTLDILERDDIKSIIRQYRGTDAKTKSVFAIGIGKIFLNKI